MQGEDSQMSYKFPEGGAANGMEENTEHESQFASHLKTSEAASNFSRSKTIREQREFLPVYSVRDEVLRIIRDNQGNLQSCL
jgi:pre-mRNA-splicing factor ATP-dependent RNA helicase DHX38/PRP16